MEIESMKKQISVYLPLCTLAVAVVFALSATPVSAGASGEDIYKNKKCGTCHANTAATKASKAKKGTYLGDVGGKRTAAWLDEYMKDPEAMRKKDAKLAEDSKKNFDKPMKKTAGLSAEDRKALVDYMMTLK